MTEAIIRGDGQSATYLLFMLGGQLFGIAVEDVQSVEELNDLTNVPLSGNHIGGVCQLHGHIITAIKMREALKLPTTTTKEGNASFIVDWSGHQYCVLIDDVIGVFDLDQNDQDKIPKTVDPNLRKIGNNVLKHDGNLVLTTTAEALMEVL